MEGAKIETGKTGVYTHFDEPTDKRVPVWFHCSSHFSFAAPALAKAYERTAPQCPPPAQGSEEFPMLGTPFMDDNADSDDEGGMGAAEVAMNGTSAADVGPCKEREEEDDDEEDEKEDEEEEGQRTHSHVVIVMHGSLRNAAQYLEAWKPIADRFGLLVLCPQFSAAEFPEYNTGGMFDRATGRAVRKDQWLFSVVERVFDGLAGMGVHRTHYHLYGHSAGAQFVHRMLVFLPEARVHTAVAANADWYTFPSLDAPFPYGLHCSGVDAAALRAVLGKRLVVLLGQEDAKTLHLRRTRRALAQGVTRFDRGLNFFLLARSVAHNLAVPLCWSLRTVEAVGHAHDAMSAAAVQSFAFVAHPDAKPAKPAAPLHPSAAFPATARC